jgi:hypothetical protein
MYSYPGGGKQLKNIFNVNNEKISDKAFSRSLLVSVVSILLCTVLLCSVTYAWFSDGQATANHIITAGSFSVDVSVVDDNAGEVTVDTLPNGCMIGILENKNTTYTVSLSITPGSNVKGYCAISFNDGENITTVLMSNDPALGVDTISFTVTTAEDSTTVSFIPVWGYPAAPTVEDGDAIVLG